MKSSNVKFKRAPETKFLTVDSIIFDKFSPHALKVYGQLRQLTSYTKECDETEITVKNLAILCGISERKTFDVLNELEYTHFMIQRTNVYHFRYGHTNTFVVSQTYNYFKPVQELHTPAPHAVPVDNCVQNLSPSAYYAEGSARGAEGSAYYADLREQEFSQESFKKKQKQGQKPVPVSVFSETQEIKTHITQTLVNRKESIPDHLIDEIIFYVGIHRGYNDVVKKVNIALKMIRDKRWNTPHGYKGITSKSIREKEERDQKAKEIQNELDAKNFRQLAAKVALSPVPSTIEEYRNRMKPINTPINSELKLQNDLARHAMMQSLGIRSA